MRYRERDSSRIQREEKGRKKMNAALLDAAQLRNLIFCIYSYFYIKALKSMCWYFTHT